MIMKELELFTDNLFYILHYSSSNINKAPVEISCISILNGKTGDIEYTFSRVDFDEKVLLKKFFDLIKIINSPILTWNMKKRGLIWAITPYQEI